MCQSLLIDGRLFLSIETLRNKCSVTEETYIMKLQWRQRTSPQTWLLSSYTAIAPCRLQCAVFIFMSVQVLLQLVTHETGFFFQKWYLIYKSFLVYDGISCRLYLILSYKNLFPAHTGHIQSSHERQADRELPPATRADTKIWVVVQKLVKVASLGLV